ncbi:C2H2-type zinc finger protein [Haladaptatus sp. DFWS20]
MEAVTHHSPVGSTMSEETYRCEACGTEFDTKDELRKHMREQGLVD